MKPLQTKIFAIIIFLVLSLALTSAEELSASVVISDETDANSQTQATAEATSIVFPNMDNIVKTDATFDLPSITSNAASGESSEIITGPDSIITESYSINDPSKENIVVPDFVDFNFPEKRPVAEASTDLEKPLPNILTTASVVQPADADTCSGATDDLFSYIYKSYIDNSSDVDWYRGYKAGTNTLRFILVPPYNRDYDIAIYDSCSGGIIASCTAGSGTTENCTATVTDYFYVKVYGYSNAYSATAPYRITAKDSGSCSGSMTAGTLSKSTYLCNDTIRVDDTRLYNNSSSTMYHYFYRDLYTSGNNYYSEYASSSYYSIPPSSYYWWWTEFYPPASGGWPESGSYATRGYTIYWCGSNIQTTRTLIYPNVSCTAGTIVGYNGTPSKSSYACNENIVTQNHTFSNTSNTYTYNYTLYYELRDPNNNIITSGNSPNQSLSPGYGAGWTLTWYPPAGGWLTSGTYTAKVWTSGTFSDGRNATAYSYAYPYVPTAPCANCSISGSDGSPSKSSFKSYENIITQNHKFTNSGNQTYNYTFNYELRDSGNNLVSSGNNPNQSLSPGYEASWTVTATPPVVWLPVGTYTMKTWVSGTCTDNTSKTVYSYAYPSVESTCYATSVSASVYQDGLCTNSIITKHKFANYGNLNIPYNINFYLYDPNNSLMGTGSNSYSFDPKYNNEWTVTWNLSSGTWKAGTYRAETVLNGTCSNGQSTTASNSTNPSMPSSCTPGSCNGAIHTNVKDGLGLNLQNAKVYKDGSFYGATDGSGNILMGTSSPVCGSNYNVAVYCPEGTYCGSQSTTIDFPDDDDYLDFSCTMCQSSAPKLNVTLSANFSYYLNDQISLSIAVKDNSGSPTDASLSIYNPFTNSTVSAATSGGSYTYNTTATKTGSYAYSVSAAKSGYQGGSASRAVSVRQFNGSILVDVDNLKGNPINNAKVYVDGIFKGSTVGNGQATISSDKGNHSVSTYCPDSSYCGTQSINVTGSHSLYFDCYCVLDSDLDGISDDDESLIGTDPNNASSNLTSMLSSQKLSTGCFNPLAVFLPSSMSSEQKKSFVNSMKTMDYSQLSAFETGNNAGIKNVLTAASVPSSQNSFVSTDFRNAYIKAKDVNAFTSADGTVVIVLNDSAGNTSIVISAAHCSGIVIGAVDGAVSGAVDDLSFAAAVLKGLVYYAFHFKEIGEAIKPVFDFFTYLPQLFGKLGDIIHDVTIDILKKGAQFNYWKNLTDKEDYAAFEVGFLQGYTVGYVAEQAVLLGKIAEWTKVGELFKGINITEKGGALIGKAFEAYSRIASKFGAAIANNLKGFRLKIFEWTSGPAQDFAARLTKMFSKTSDADDWLYKLGANAEQVAAKGERVTQKLIADLGQDAAEKAMGKLVNSQYGRLALEQWGNENAIKQYAKMFEEFASYPDKITRISTKFSMESGGAMEKLMANFDELESLNITGFSDWRRGVISGAAEGLSYESDIAIIIKNKGYTIEQLGRKVTTGIGDTEIDNIFNVGAKKVAAEIKSGDPMRFLDTERGYLDQMKKYKQFAAGNGIDEVWLISKQPVPFEIKQQFENIGVIVKWAGEI